MAALTGKSTTEIKDTFKGAVNGKGDRLLEDAKNTDIGILNGEQPLHGAVLLERSSSRSGTLKKEADSEENGTGAKNGARGSPRNLPPPLLVPESNKSDRPARGRSSKPATPQLGSFPDSSDASETNGTLAMGNKTKKVTARTVRQKDQLVDSLSPTGLPLKRSHKKGAGMAAQAAALRAKELQQPEDDAATSSMADEDYEEAPDGDEEKYCICQQGSYGEMVACDAKDCPTEWFHLSCVGLKTAPGKNGMSDLDLYRSERDVRQMLMYRQRNGTAMTVKRTLRRGRVGQMANRIAVLPSNGCAYRPSMTSQLLRRYKPTYTDFE